MINNKPLWTLFSWYFSYFLWVLCYWIRQGQYEMKWSARVSVYTHAHVIPWTVHVVQLHCYNEHPNAHLMRCQQFVAVIVAVIEAGQVVHIWTQTMYIANEPQARSNQYYWYFFLFLPCKKIESRTGMLCGWERVSTRSLPFLFKLIRQTKAQTCYCVWWVWVYICVCVSVNCGCVFGGLID